MPDHVYRIIQVAGSSGKSIEDAIQNAIGRASLTLRRVAWFEVGETRGHVKDGKVAHYQVTLKVGFTMMTTISSSSRIPFAGRSSADHAYRESVKDA
jgi:flavin-binding protein dodecin